jgi:hypothetical protein
MIDVFYPVPYLIMFAAGWFSHYLIEKYFPEAP